MIPTRHLVFYVIVILLTVSLVAIYARHGAEISTGDKTGNGEISDFLEEQAGGNYHHLSAFRLENQKVSFGGLGASPDDTFEIASITKVFTVELLRLQLANGMISDSTTIGDVLGEQVHSCPIKDVSVKELANHTSGLPRLGNVGIKPRLAVFLDKNPYANITTNDVIVAACKAQLKKRGEFKYSNLGYALLGYILATNAGTDYASLLKREIIIPLGLNNTYLMTPGSTSDSTVRGYNPKGNEPEPWEMDGYLPAAGLRSTARDMSVFARYMLTREFPEFGWQNIEENVQVHWHDGQSFGFSSVLFIDKQENKAAFIAADVSESVIPMGLELLELKNNR